MLNPPVDPPGPGDPPAPPPIAPPFVYLQNFVTAATFLATAAVSGSALYQTEKLALPCFVTGVFLPPFLGALLGCVVFLVGTTSITKEGYLTAIFRAIQAPILFTTFFVTLLFLPEGQAYFGLLLVSCTFMGSLQFLVLLFGNERWVADIITLLVLVVSVFVAYFLADVDALDQSVMFYVSGRLALVLSVAFKGASVLLGMRQRTGLDLFGNHRIDESTDARCLLLSLIALFLVQRALSSSNLNLHWQHFAAENGTNVYQWLPQATNEACFVSRDRLGQEFLRGTTYLAQGTANKVLFVHSLVTGTTPSYYSNTCPEVRFLYIIFSPVLASMVSGALVVFCFLKKSYGEFRHVVVGWVWTFIHRFLLKLSPSGQNFPGVPEPNVDMGPTPLHAYYVHHPNAAPLWVPSSDSVPEPQHINWVRLSIAFWLMNWLDTYLPCARCWIHPNEKPRVQDDRGIDFYWPSLMGMPHPPPSRVVRAFPSNPGNMLNWLINYGSGSRELRRATNDEMTRLADLEIVPNANVVVDQRPFILDLSHMEVYRVKPGFAKCGGKAVFRLTNVGEELQNMKSPRVDHVPAGLTTFPAFQQVAGRPLALVCMFGPGDSIQMKSPIFLDRSAESRHAERQIFASVMTLNVVIYHLLEIHTITSIVSMAIHNAFDVGEDAAVRSPFRAILHLHFFNSVEVQEKTTPHLLDLAGIFPQVFALEHADLCEFINNKYRTYQYAKDTDWEERVAKHVTPSMEWENIYLNSVFLKYASAIVNAIWADDDAVATDNSIQRFRERLCEQLRAAALPARHGQLETRKELARFLADTIHVVTVRHEIVGTKVPLAQLDHRYTGNTQQLEDYSNIPLEEYLSMLQITAATALKSFPQFLNNPTLLNEFNAAVENYVGAPQNAINAAFEQLLEDLRIVNAHWKASPEQNDWNDAFLRTCPEELEIGAGY